MAGPLPWPPGLTAEQIFNTVNLVLPAWALLIFAPRWRWTRPSVLALASTLSVLYSALFFKAVADYGFLNLYAQFFTYGGVVSLLRKPELALTTWVHVVVSDLLAALWMVGDAADQGVPTLVISLHAALSLAIPPPTTLLLYVLAIRPLLSARLHAPVGAAMSSADLKDD